MTFNLLHQYTLEDINKNRDAFNKLRDKSLAKIMQRYEEDKRSNNPLDESSIMQGMIINFINAELNRVYGEYSNEQ